MIEPGEVVLHDGALRFGLGNSMTEAFVDNHLHLNTLVFERLSKFVRIGDWNAAIEFAMLNQGRSTRVLNVGD